MAFQQFLSLEDLTDAEANQLKEHCYRGYVEIESHYLFHGKDEDSYSKVTFWLRGVQYHFRRHHLSLFLHMREEGKTESEWPDGLDVSHLCHKKRCFRPDHLRLEDRALNKSRDKCWKEKRCRGHGNAPSCLL